MWAAVQSSKGKGKGSSLNIAPTYSPGQRRFTTREVAADWHSLYAFTVCSQQAYYPQSTSIGLHPVIHVPNYMDHYSLTDP